MSTAPDFSLPDTEGEEHGPDGVTVITFTCNHCPYALAWHDRLLNIHPSLLPAFRGLDTHARALAAGVRSGMTATCSGGVNCEMP